jgi:hypothetical protein
MVNFQSLDASRQDFTAKLSLQSIPIQLLKFEPFTEIDILLPVFEFCFLRVLPLLEEMEDKK